MKWIKSKISDLIEEFERGISYSSEEIKDNSGVPMMNLACIDKTGFYREGELKFFSGNYSEADKVYPNDMLVACTDLTRNADIIGTPILVPSGAEFYLYTMDLAKLTPKANIDKMFLYYALKTSTYRKYIKPWASGTTVLHLNLQGMYDYELYYPEKIDDQQKLAQILADIDSKISLNKQINQNLEALAKQLYDYWFVQFDFPDENGKPYKSSGGKMVWNERLKREIPQGWEVKTINDLAEVFNGATPSTSDSLNYGGDIIWITPKDLSNQQSKFIIQGERNITDKGYGSCSTHLLPVDSILMSSRAPIGLFTIAKTELCTNQGFKSFVPKDKLLNSYLYYYLLQYKKRIERLGTGTTFKEVSRDDMLKFLVLTPNTNILHLFEEKAKAIGDEQLTIQNENSSLIKQRNELLPLLMNGQVNFDLSAC